MWSRIKLVGLRNRIVLVYRTDKKLLLKNQSMEISIHSFSDMPTSKFLFHGENLIHEKTFLSGQFSPKKSFWVYEIWTCLNKVSNRTFLALINLYWTKVYNCKFQINSMEVLNKCSSWNMQYIWARIFAYLWYADLGIIVFKSSLTNISSYII